jgi:two-component system, chemotaxis family, CheB/CheR fusion protein
MPEALLRYVRHGYIATPGGIATRMPDEPPSMLEAILARVRSRSGHDFANYKRSTLLRRIHRRMGLSDLETLADYAELLRANPAEIKALTKDLMISVTGFFRDPKAWEALDATVLAPLAAERKQARRCASGCRPAPPARKPIRWPCWRSSGPRRRASSSM